MKILWRIVLVAVLLITGSSTVWAKQVEKVLVIENNGEQIEVGKALCDGNEILIPATVITNHVYLTAAIDEDNSQLKTHFAMTRFRLAEKDLTKQMSRNNLINLPYKNIGGIYYIDGAVAGRVFGFTIEAQANQMIVRTNVYSAFKPQIFAKKERVLPEKVVLVWQPVFDDDVDVTKSEKIPGLNVVSPSWMAVTKKDGTIINTADYRYVKEAHARGYQVWPLITNSFNSALTQEVLQSEKARANVIRQLVTLAKLYEFDGINIDFETMYDEDRDAFSTFMREASVALKAIGMVTSIDVTVPGDKKCYDRKALAEQVDYMMLMAYDEHWRTSPVSGSVASIGWVEEGIVNSFKEEVPAEKIVLGIPFYMRRWQEYDQKIIAKTMTMTDAEDMIRTRQLQPRWLIGGGQYYFEYQEGDSRYRIWQEEERSIALKLDLINKYSLAGVAAWRKGFEKSEIWQLINEKMFPVTTEDIKVKK